MKKQTKKTANKKITIEDLAGMVQRGFLNQAERFDNKLQNFSTKEDFKNLEDQILTGFDKILGKLEKMDHESIVHDYKHKRIDEMLELHNTKIKKLETKK